MSKLVISPFASVRCCDGVTVAGTPLSDPVSEHGSDEPYLAALLDQFRVPRHPDEVAAFLGEENRDQVLAAIDMIVGEGILARERVPGSAAIAVTLRGASPAVVESFVRYHQAIGFDHLFLFFDDPVEREPQLRERPGVTMLACDDALRKRWTRLRGYPQWGQFAQSEVMARQCLNTEMAVELASRQGCSWLLHIDIDELFYLPAMDVREHFLSLESQGLFTAVYNNHEAVPERADIDNYFAEVTLFRLHPATLAVPTAPSERPPQASFLYYGNGKSAARVTPGTLPQGVHRFAVQTSAVLGHASAGVQQPATPTAARDSMPVILHYPCCGFDAFYSKYRILGGFADKWFGSIDIRSSIGPFHVDARDVVASGDVDRARRFFAERVMLPSPEVKDDLLKKGFCRRIAEPARLIERMLASLSPGPR